MFPRKFKDRVSAFFSWRIEVDLRNDQAVVSVMRINVWKFTINREIAERVAKQLEEDCSPNDEYGVNEKAKPTYELMKSYIAIKEFEEP